MANIREGGQVTLADLQSKYDLLVAQNEALANRFERMVEMQKNAPNGIQRISDIPSGISNGGRVAEFLEGEARPFAFYSEHRNFCIVLKYGKFLGISGDGQNMRDTDLIVRFVPFNGVGAEIPDPEDQRKRKFNWGILHVESVPEVVSGKMSAADLVDMLKDTAAFKATGTIFDDEEARARLRIEYDILKARASEQNRRAKVQASRPAGAKKGGGLALAATGGIPDLD